ncbi:MAG: GNAT family N-acetyltransferase [Oscillospiraceae bacterium]|jgi:GNAT superfamily N-acetyltransferase
MYEIKRGGHADMKRIYPMMEFDFKDWERPSLADCQIGMIRGAELLLLKDEAGLEAGYAYMLRDAARRYALLGWLSVYPTVRGNGVGGEFLELIKAWYERYECVFIEVTEYPELEKARKLANFYRRHGWKDSSVGYEIGGRETLLLQRGDPPLRADLRGVIEAVYAPMYSPARLPKYVRVMA